MVLTTGFVLVKKKKRKKTSNTVTIKKTNVPYYDTNYLLVIDKSDYELRVFDKDGWLVTYPVVFGNRTLADKRMEGDNCTPEGIFRIINKNPHELWNKFMLLDYPNAASYQKFAERKAKEEIPQDAKIGGGIGIHGTFPDSDFVVDQYVNWTQGCISLKNADVNELYALLPMHTKIIIQH
jgi:murein L,D-transpeptidase YafK